MTSERLNPSARVMRALVCLGAFLCCVGASAMQVPYGPTFGFSDHFTHMNAARLFPRIGLALWRRPIDQILPEATHTQQAAAPPDVRVAGTIREVDGWPIDKPFVGGWTQVARPYPPGDLLVVAPVAVAYHFTRLSFGGACHLLVVTFLVFAHFAIYLIWNAAPAGRDRRLYLATAVLAYGYLIFWTMRGFYDAAAMLPLVAASAYLGDRRWLAAIVAMSAALFCHFRALFYVPWGLFAVYQLIRGGSWRSWRGGEWFAAVTGAVLTATSLIAFVLVSPALAKLPFENPIHPGHVMALPFAAFGASVGVALIAFYRQRSKLDVAMALWIVAMLISARQVQSWHTILMLPWLFAPAATWIIRAGRALFLVVVTVAVFL